jgi:hypothetical protein
MSDAPTGQTPDETPAGAEPDEIPTEAAPPAPRKPSPAAAAASRARRIGGRPAGAPRPSPAPTGAKTAPEEGAEPTTSLRKPPARKAAPAAEPTPVAPDRDAAGGPDVPVWLNWAPAAVLSVGAVVMAILLIVFSHGVWWGPSPDDKPNAATVNQQRERILAAAKTCVVAANDYAYTDLDGYEKRALACTTGALTGKLRTTIESLVKAKAPQLKAKQTTQISRGGVQTVSPDGKQWTLLVFGQLSVVNANYPKGRTDPFGAEVTMEKVGGRWVMSDLNTVSAPVQG